MAMKQSHIEKFNRVYSDPVCYYGSDLRPEFTDFFNGRDLSGKHALDLGCGEGRYSLYLARNGCRVTAIDRSEAGMQKLKTTVDKQHLDINPTNMDIDAFDFAGNSMDIVVAATILDHLTDALRARVVDGIRTALKPGGILYANVFTVDDPGFLIQRGTTALPPDMVSDTAECMEHYFDRGELINLFPDLHTLYYYEGIEPDTSHGRPHRHGWACLLAKKCPSLTDVAIGLGRL
jgi:SAM-dependent methyltransferase